MFAARYHDPSLENFSREEAVKLIPKSNPFLRKLFKDIADEDLDIRLNWIIDELVSIFLASDVLSIMKDFGKSTKQEDPVVHFYETFLGAYNPALRKARGVWYTPQPVVNFIVRAVDDILKSEFDLPEGLADSSKKKIKVNLQGRQIEKEVHKVQILDPATGTGTFLAETIKHIHSKYVGMQGIWSKYVEDDLIPRINGFELLMASYAMAHLKLDMLLTETGYVPTRDQRLRVFLTNSLEEAHPDSGTLWGSLLSEEADQANEIKRDTPVMCIIGNPPYSGISSNNGKWISDLIDDYKYVDGIHFNERKHWLNDDYVKFLRYGQHFIEKNGQGVLAFINPHGFLDNPTFKGMRWNLLKTYDKIYTIDLHGNSKKKEKATDGSTDVNVFDIMQGVSINIFVKTGKKNIDELGSVSHFDVFGKREFKYDFLTSNSIHSIPFSSLTIEKPYFFFVPKSNLGHENYEKGIKITDLFPLNTSGMVTANDKLSIFMTETELINTTNRILSASNPYEEFKIEDSRRVSKETRLLELKEASKKGAVRVNYKPFDIQFMYHTKNNEHWINSPRNEVMQHFLLGSNVGLVVARQCSDDWKYVFCTDVINVFNLTGTAGRLGSGNTFPLYVYNQSNGQQTIDQSANRTPNLNSEIIREFSKCIDLTYTWEKETTNETFAPLDILDYVYAILHSPTYRETYKEFLKIDFPRVPYPKDKVTFWQLVKLGGELRQVHLLESPVVDKPISKYPISGTNIIGKPKYENGKVMINDTQYFEDVPEVAWNFYIGGYQPAQKWLKDRKDRELQIDDIRHYMKIIVALSETDRLMKEIDKIIIH
jgi:predicted helicase